MRCFFAAHVDAPYAAVQRAQAMRASRARRCLRAAAMSDRLSITLSCHAARCAAMPSALRVIFAQFHAMLIRMITPCYDFAATFQILSPAYSSPMINGTVFRLPLIFSSSCFLIVAAMPDDAIAFDAAADIFFASMPLPRGVPLLYALMP